MMSARQYQNSVQIGGGEKIKGDEKKPRDMGAEMFGKMGIVPVESDYLRNVIGFYKGELSEARVLDIGCGTGNYSLGLADTVKEIVGIDISEGMIRIAEENRDRINATNAHFHLADWKYLIPGEGLLAEKFDIIIIHMTPALRTMDDLQKVLDSSRGCCYYTTGLFRSTTVRDELDKHCPDRVPQPRTFFYRIMDHLADRRIRSWVAYDSADYSMEYTVKECVDLYQKMYSELTPKQMREIIRPLARKGGVVNNVTHIEFMTLYWDTCERMR